MAIALVIDLGTTNLKIGIVNENGSIINVRSVGLNIVRNNYGEAEHNPAELKELIIETSKKLLKENKIIEVDYIVGSTYQFGLILLDAEKKPLTGITLLTDIRSQKTFEGFLKTFEDVDLYGKTGCPLLTNYQLPRLFYFSKIEQALYQKTKFFADSKAFLFEWLTGEFTTDISTAAATQHFNLHTYCWDETLLDKVGLSTKQFPEVKDGTNYFAELRDELRIALGLKNKAKVLLGVYDGASLAVGLSALEFNMGIVNIGTSAMLRVPGTKPIFDKDENKRIQPYALRKNFFLNGGALNNAALPLNWLKSNLFDVDLDDSSMLRTGDQPPLVCLPYLSSERDSKTGPYASGVYFGLKPYHTKIDVARATMEGVAYGLRYIYEALKENDLALHNLKMGGGGIHIKTWPQIFANILGLEVQLAPGDQMALVGSAMLAFVADNLYKDLSDLGSKIFKKGTSVQPDLDALEIHNERYLFYKKLKETLSPLYKEHSSMGR